MSFAQFHCGDLQQTKETGKQARASASTPSSEPCCRGMASLRTGRQRTRVTGVPCPTSCAGRQRSQTLPWTRSLCLGTFAVRSRTSGRCLSGRRQQPLSKLDARRRWSMPRRTAKRNRNLRRLMCGHWLCDKTFGTTTITKMAWTGSSTSELSDL